MTTTRTIAIALGAVLAATLAFAHHAPGSLGTVRIAEPVMAGDTMLQPGTYELRDTGEHLSPLPGQSPDAATWVEFVAGGKVIAREGAEMIEAANQTVGTSGRASASRPRIEHLKDNEFVRISAYRDGSRYLIYLRPAAGSKE
jgi:hypothetical protein